jgi:hypothetical protein
MTAFFVPRRRLPDFLAPRDSLRAESPADFPLSFIVRETGLGIYFCSLHLPEKPFYATVDSVCADKFLYLSILPKRNFFHPNGVY